jgi:hypothetical protein
LPRQMPTQTAVNPHSTRAVFVLPHFGQTDGTAGPNISTRLRCRTRYYAARGRQQTQRGAPPISRF